MTKVIKPQSKRLEERAVDAQRTYVAALVALERARHEASCSTCGVGAMTAGDLARAWRAAEDHKEKCRRAFSDLCNELGYIPQGHGVALPDEGHVADCENRGSWMPS